MSGRKTYCLQNDESECFNRRLMFDWINNNTPACSRKWTEKENREWYAENCPIWKEDWYWETVHPYRRPSWKLHLPYIFWQF